MPILFLIAQLIILLFSVVIHEVSHGLVALRLGDPTAKYKGRLTLNPLKHLDLWGSLLFPLFVFAASGGSILFGWAKPVPYNPYNLKNQRWGPALVGIAGPVSNLIVAAIFGLVLRYFSAFSLNPAIGGSLTFFALIVLINVLLAVFNLVPIPPLDGSKVLFALLPARFDEFKMNLERYGLMLLLLFIFFGFRLIYPLVNLISRFFAGSSLLF